MDPTSEKNCLDEISSLVLDANEKVTLKMMSNNWLITNEVAKNVLLKWLELNANKVKDEVVKEFLVRGINTKGINAISVVPEATRLVLEKKWQKFHSWIYSIEMRSNTRKLDLPDYESIEIKQIILKPATPRDLLVPDIPMDVPIIKAEPTTSKNTAKTPFSVMRPLAKTEVKQESRKEIKKEPKVEVAKPVLKSPEKKTETPIKEEEPKDEKKAEKKSPTEGSSKANNKKVQLKNQKPVAGKASISSFFNNKPGVSKPAPKEKPVEVKKAEPKAVSPKKRSLSPEQPVVDKKKKPAAKKIRMKEPTNNKRSRIRVMEDSSEEEEEKEESEPESKLIKFDREFTPDRNTSPISIEDSPKQKPDAVKTKHKAKRWVTKRFQTEDGFMRTERVQEEYSASEDENDENRKKNSPPKSEKPAVINRSPDKPERKKKKTSPPEAPTGKKQGNIMSFFTKK